MRFIESVKILQYVSVNLFYAEGIFYFVDGVEGFPSKESNLDVAVACIAVVEMLGDCLGVAAHVSVGGCLGVDGLAEVKSFLDGVGGHVETFHSFHHLGNLAVGEVDAGGATGVDAEADRLCHADGVGYLHEGLTCDTGGNEVFGDVAGGIGCRAVDLGGVFARECAAAVGAAAAIGVDDDFAACQAGVAVGASDDKFSGGVYKHFYIVVNHCCDLGGEGGLDAWDEDAAHVGLDAFLHLFISSLLGQTVVGGDEFVVLGGDDDGVYAQGVSVLAVLDSHLTLGVGAQVGARHAVDGVGHLFLLAAQGGEFEKEPVAEVDGEGHVGVGLVTCETKHHPLVASSLQLAFLCVAVNASVDVGTLLVERVEDSAGFAVKFQLAAVVAYFLDNASGDFHQVDVGLALDFAGDNDLPGGDEGLAGYF